MKRYIVMEQGPYPDWGFVEADSPEEAAKKWEALGLVEMKAGVVAEVKLDPCGEATA